MFTNPFSNINSFSNILSKNEKEERRQNAYKIHSTYDYFYELTPFTLIRYMDFVPGRSFG